MSDEHCICVESREIILMLCDQQVIITKLDAEVGLFPWTVFEGLKQESLHN
jgi:hypothetical protein